MNTGFLVFYMISESATRKHVPKLPNATKERCLLNFRNEFKNSRIKYCADNISHGMETFITRLLKSGDDIIPVRGGTQSLAFGTLLDIIETLDAPNTLPVLIQEDDYLYLPGAEHKMLDALEYGHYVTGYLHPDKFMDPSKGGNPSTHADNISEETRVIKTRSSFWMLTNSTTGTFATTLGTLKEDVPVWRSYSVGKFVTEDYNAFIELRKRGRSVLMPIPTLSTHVMPQWLAPLTGTTLDKWENLKENNYVVTK